MGHLRLHKKHDIGRNIVIETQANQLLGEKCVVVNTRCTICWMTKSLGRSVGSISNSKPPIGPELRTYTHVSGNRQLASIKNPFGWIKVVIGHQIGNGPWHRWHVGVFVSRRGGFGCQPWRCRHGHNQCRCRQPRKGSVKSPHCTPPVSKNCVDSISRTGLS